MPETTAPNIGEHRQPRRRNAVALTPVAAAPLPAVTSSLDIVRAALAAGDVDMYREAVTLMKELDAFAARKAFNNALAGASAQFPIINKSALVSYENRDETVTTYKHETLAGVVGAVAPILSAHGLSHRWRVSGKPGQPVTVTCIISHRDGHFEENELSAPADKSGGKNDIQAVKSTVSYLERITLMASLGLASKEDDDDGCGADEAAAGEGAAPYTPPPGAVSQEQADQIREALEAKGANRNAFLQWAAKGIKFPGKPRIEDIPADYFDSCIEAIASFKGGRK